jgi:two-component system, cell cycle sensor histidine kinase and response regulator CckA
MPHKHPQRRDPPTRVLVVDDSPLACRMVTQMLNDAGYGAESAPDGATALRTMERGPFDVVVTDLHMPPPDGFGLLEAVHQRDPLLPVIILTGSHAHDVNAAIQALRLGAQDYLTKPLAGPEQIVLAVERALAQRRQREALRETQKMEAVGRLAGGLAHDFNNALGIIMGTVSLMKNDPQLQGRAAADVETIGKAAERAARLTRQLLAFSRRQVLQPKVVDLSEVVRGMAELLQSVTGETVRLGLELLRDPCLARVDVGQVEQCVTNLTMNACDAMPSGGRITLETSHVDVDATGAPVETPPIPPGAYVCLAVGDDGVGIEPPVMARLFEPFFTTKGRDRSNGLGLAVVHGIVTQHGGHVRVESEPGQGASFRLYFPRAGAAAQAAAKPLASEQPQANAAPGETVLLVEDNDELRTLLCRGLRLQGYTVIEASDGPTALATIERQLVAPEVVVSDVVMPGGMSGVDLASSIARLRPAVKVILMSGHPRSGPARDEILQPTTAFIAKPFAIEALAQKIREVMQQTGAEASSAR